MYKFFSKSKFSFVIDQDIKGCYTIASEVKMEFITRLKRPSLHLETCKMERKSCKTTTAFGGMSVISKK